MTGTPAELSLAAEWLRDAKKITVFTGAGASAESGIPTFRDEGGVWDRFPPEQFATPHGLLATALRHPRLVAEFLLGLIEPIAAADPNGGHLAVAELEKRAHVTVVTQNIDGLHQDAGSTKVHEVHGSLFEIVTLGGEPVRRVTRTQLRQVTARLKQSLARRFAPSKALRGVRPILGFNLHGLYRPNIVLFGEAMAEPAWTHAWQACEECECMLMVGTSGVVYPAAMLPERAKSAGAYIISVGLERTFCDIWLRGTAATVLPLLIREAYS
ncbi:MAG TPA: Sir2 family NAD-dependent protein deacetylase [Phycisphaerae bacterium]|nr:Sir2 family NAD-dependent protein deacetylase [Phycisphaerae bacterium]